MRSYSPALICADEVNLLPFCCQTRRSLCEDALLKIRGVISFTFQMAVKRCVVRIRSDLKAEVSILSGYWKQLETLFISWYKWGFIIICVKITLIVFDPDNVWVIFIFAEGLMGKKCLSYLKVACWNEREVTSSDPVVLFTSVRNTAVIVISSALWLIAFNMKLPVHFMKVGSQSETNENKPFLTGFGNSNQLHQSNDSSASG